MKKDRVLAGLLWLSIGFAAALWPALAVAQRPDRDPVLATMKSATRFMIDQVSMNGGYVWCVSENLETRWGELLARPSQIWLQGGTERVGEVLLEAYTTTGDTFYRDAARKVADAVVYGQLPEGGWHYFIDFDPQGVPDWYRTTSSKFRFGMEEYRYFYGNATFDDRVTSEAARFLLRYYNATREAAYRTPVLLSLEFVMNAQYPNGAWPQRFPLRGGYAHDGFPDYTGFYTLNDGATEAIIELLLEAWETLGNPRYFESASRGVDALIAMQGPEGQAAWAEQYGPDMKPIAARTHEPPGYVVRESLQVVSLLERFYLITGDDRYLAPIPPFLDWLERVNRELAAERYPRPRYWEPGTNKPLYVVRTDDVTPEGYGTYIWTTDPALTRCGDKPCEGDGSPIADVVALRQNYEGIASLDTPRARASRLKYMRDSNRQTATVGEYVSEIISALDSRGAWVTDCRVNQPNAESDEKSQETIRGISTRVYADRMSALIAYLRRLNP